MQPLKRPKGFYLSYSRINLYYSDPQQYYLRYVLKVRPPETANMAFGKIGHRAIAEPKYDWKTALRRQRFMSEKEVVLERALNQIIRPEKSEVQFTVTHNGITLFGIWDGLNMSRDEDLEEYKFSAPGAWNQQKVNEDLQLSIYWYAYMLKYGKEPRWIVLRHINNTTGRMKSYRTKRNRNDIEGVKNIIEYCYVGIKKGVWTH
jgi:hypothetical protein